MGKLYQNEHSNFSCISGGWRPANDQANNTKYKRPVIMISTSFKNPNMRFYFKDACEYSFTNLLSYRSLS